MRSFLESHSTGMDLESQAQPSETFANTSTEMRSDPAGTGSGTLACDLNSLLSFSCRTRAESFARKLHLKLKTLGSFDGNEDQTLSSGLSEEVNGNSSSIPSYSWDTTLESAATELEKLSLSSSSGSSPMQAHRVSPAATTPESGKSPKSYPSAFRPPAQEETQNSSSDSDIFYDFDIGPGSPGSPVETGTCFTVINACDDLTCQDCLGQSSTTNGHAPPNLTNGLDHSLSNGSGSADQDFESGCVFSSPASTSPDGYETVTEDPMQAFRIEIQHSASADDCTSDASDCSVYYDVDIEATVEIPTAAPEPKSEPVVAEEDLKPRASLFEVSDRQLLSPGFGLGQTDDDEDDDSDGPSRPMLIRSSSLKTGKTPPGTPGHKKIVRFADALGLDLAAVRTFMDEIPNVPKSAFRDLVYPLETASLTATSKVQRPACSSTFNKLLVPTFHQPSSRSDFFDRIRDQKVLLENAFLSDNFTIKGTVRVMNMDFHKSVYIRYTLDEWKTFTDFQATYVNGSCDGFSDLFEFALTLKPEQIEVGCRLVMAVRFHCKGEQFWDSNAGQNYLFHCVPASTQSSQQGLYHDTHHHYSSVEDPWVTHMMW